MATRLARVSQEFQEVAQKPGAGDMIATLALILQALTIVVNSNEPAKLTSQPSSRQSPKGWARAIVAKAKVRPTVRLRSEVIEEFLARIEHLVASKPPPGTKDVDVKRCMFLVQFAEDLFPQFFVADEDDPDPDNMRRVLAKKLAKRHLNLNDPEQLMRATLRVCGMSPKEIRGLTNYRNQRAKRGKE
jgi:hypothetical protein